MLSRISSFSSPLAKLFKLASNIFFTTRGLILRYEINDKNSYTGASSVTDLVGNSSATLINGPTFSLNGYINFDGTNDYLMTDTSLNSKLSPANTSTILSLFVWVYPIDNGVIVTEQGSTSLNSGWHDSQIEVVSGAIRFGVWNGLGSSYFVSTVSISPNNWYYVGFTYDGTTLRGYINSQEAGSVVVSRATPWNNGGNVGLFYGVGSFDSTSLGDGTYAKMKLGAFHVYNVALTPQEVINNYLTSYSNFIVTSNLLIWIDANDPSSFSGSSTLTDLSGNNYTHTFASGVTSSIVFGFKSFDCGALSNNFIRVSGTGPTLSNSGYTYVAWARISTDSSTWRTLYRSDPNDHALLVELNSNRLGFYDNDSNSFKDSGYDVTSIEEKWVQYSVVGDSSSTTFYIDDVQVGTVAWGAGGNKHDYFGAINGQPFGYVGNMMLYNTKLTADQIKQNYDALKHVYSNGDFVISNLKLYLNPQNLLSYPGTGTTIYDLSGNSLNGTLSNITFDKTYFDFNGSSSQVSITDNSLLEPGSNDWTMEAWFKVDNVSGSKVILGKFDNGGLANDVSYSIRTSNSSVYCQIGNGLGNTQNINYSNSNSYTISTGIWYQAVYVYSNSGDTLKTYINGNFIGSVSCTIGNLLNSSNNLYIGSYNNGEYSQWMNGGVGIVRIYSSALSDSDVSKNFESNRNIYGI